MRVGICAGHTLVSEGRRYREHVNCKSAAEMLDVLLLSGGYETRLLPAGYYGLSNNRSLRERVQYFNKNEVDVVVSLHTNALNGRANYSTTIFADGSRNGERLARTVEAAVDASLPWRSIGARPMQGYFDRQLWLLRKTRMPAVIVEPCFDDDPKVGREWFNSKAFVMDYATAVYAGVSRYAKEAA
jgi:N-acetylmuramoyl-L-alanine amidase